MLEEHFVPWDENCVPLDEMYNCVPWDTISSHGTKFRPGKWIKPFSRNVILVLVKMIQFCWHCRCSLTQFGRRGICSGGIEVKVFQGLPVKNYPVKVDVHIFKEGKQIMLRVVFKAVMSVIDQTITVLWTSNEPVHVTWITVMATLSEWPETFFVPPYD